MRSAIVGAVLAMGTACAGGGSGVGSGGAPSPAVGSSSGAPGTPAPNYSATVGQAFRLKIGESAAVGGASATVTFRGVTSDSRCPSGTQCVQAGSARIALDVATPQGTSSVALDTDTQREVPVGANILRLTSLTPAPHAGANPDPSSYVATLCVCRE